MWQHTSECHGDILGPYRGREDYGIEVTRSFKRALERQIDESTRIRRVDDLIDRKEVQITNREQDKHFKQIKTSNMQSKGEYYKPKT
jgi:hypothetical protein